MHVYLHPVIPSPVIYHTHPWAAQATALLLACVDKDGSIFAILAGGGQSSHFPAWHSPHWGNLLLLKSSGLKRNSMCQRCGVPVNY